MKISRFLLTKFASLAFVAAIASVGTASYFGLHQPKVPEELTKHHST